MLTIQAQNKQEVFEEIVMIDVEVRGTPMTIQVLRSEHQNDGCTILFKGPLYVLKNFLREDQSRRIDHDLII